MEEKIYFMPGDRVTLKQDIPNKPTMYVVGKKTAVFKPFGNESKEEFLKGIICRWFTDTKVLQEAVYNTKDLIKI
jgi:hypothetical protein|nr:MAG TPA: putative small protein [Caudoviricetes sp.]